MRNVLNAPSRQKFRRDESGSITAESVLWIPVYMVFFALIADVSLMLHAQAKATRIAQDANRHASTGYLVTESEIENMVGASMASISPNATIDSTIGSETIATTIQMPSTDLQVVGLFGRFTDITITVSTIHLLEL